VAATLWDRVADHVFPPTEKWLADPAAWAAERVKMPLWSKQVQIIESVRDNPDTAVHSCHNVGKSFSAAMCVCWWLDVHPPGTAFVVTTAPTGPQVKAILWREINQIHKAAGLEGRTNLTEWYMGEELVAYGRKPSEHNPTAFQGIHAIYVLVILDEACGIPETLWDAASSLTSNDSSRTLAIGNPDDPESHFAKVCKPDSGWSVIHVGAWDTPNFTGEKVSDKAKMSLITPRWVAQKAKDWGETSAIYVSKVKGLFPVDAPDGVIPYSKVAALRMGVLEPTPGPPRTAGLDVGAGGDRTVLYPRIGNTPGVPLVLLKNDAMETVGEIVMAINDWELERVTVDVIGIGWGVYSRLRELSRHIDPNGTHDAEIVPFNAAERAHEPARFKNRRAELWWQVGRELIRKQLINLTTIDDDTAAELTAPKYKIVDSSGKIQVEAKDDIRARLGRSPDMADALLMAFDESTFVAESTASTLLSARID
jgi:hypothetical protein